MKMSSTFKSLVVAAALTVAGSASAVTSYEYQLPMGVQQEFSVYADSQYGSVFPDTFGFHVNSTSSFSGSLSSTNLNINLGWLSITLYPVNFQSPTLSSGSLISEISNTGNHHTVSFSAANLSAGDYVLTVNGALPSGSPTGIYSIVGNLAPVPEPESYAMFLAGLGIIGAMARRKRG